MRPLLLAFVLLAAPLPGQEHKPLQPATAEEKKARATVVIADYRFDDLLWENDRYLILVHVQPGRPFVYYSGAVWDRGGGFATREAWNSYVDAQRTDFRP